jgi:ParB family chromosome partitioning protein
MSKTNFQENAIFWVEVDKITPNPYQPRKEFTEAGLRDLAESIRMYGVLQPLTVTRKEVQNDGGMSVEYELIAGERRLRASKLAGVVQVPVIIRSGPEDDRIKLELAIIENLQREDLNPIDRALAFKQLNDQFEFTHAQIAKKVGKSREYVSNSIRLLQLPDEIQQAITNGKISEGHARPLGMLRDKPEEQSNVFREVMLKKMTVRETEKIARSIAKDKVRKTTKSLEPEMQKMQKQLSETLGTRVMIEPKQVGGKLVIDYFSKQDVEHLLDIVNASLLNTKPGATAALDRHEQKLNNENKTEHKMAKPPENLPNDSEPEQKPIQKPGQTITSNDTSADNNKDTSADPFAYLLEDRSASSDDYSDSNNPPKTSPYQSTNELLQADSNDVDSDDDYGLSSFSV